MKIFPFIAFLWFIPAGAQGFLGSSVKFGTFYETNTYYASEEKSDDVAFQVEPNLVYLSNPSSKYVVQTNSIFSYTKFMSSANQDYFDYDLNLRNTFKFSPGFHVSLTPKAKLLSEPALAKTEDRLERQFAGATFGVLLAKDSRRQYIFEADYEQESLSQSDYEYLNNMSVSSKFYYKKYFLPETFVYFGLRGGMRSFPDGEKAATFRYKYNSQRIEPGFGLEGRLTRYFKIRSYFGYAVLQYAKDTNFNDPVYILELEEEMSPKDFILMGLENTVDDSYFTNFQINQKVYVGYGRFMGDQFLWVTKAEYLYKTFSRPQRRDDQRFIFDTRLEYSYSQKLKLEASAIFDVLSSDAVDPDGPPDPIDPSASYQNIRVGIFGKYLFE